jgi:anti-sigma factor RsiW
VTDRFSSADAHAYVDNCLGREERRAFEARLRDDPELRGRVDLWTAQNEAIRAAFGAPARPRSALSLGRHSNENTTTWMPPAIASRRGGIVERPAPTERRGGQHLVRPVPVVVETENAIAPTFRRIAATLLLALGCLCLSAFSGPLDPRDPLIEAGLSAFRTFGADSPAPLDLATRDSRVLAKWLSPRFSRLPAASNWDVPGWSLVGVRVVPGTQSAAAFLLFEDADRRRAGLLLEPLDAPVDSAPRVRERGGVVAAAWSRNGEGFVATAPNWEDAEAFARLAGKPAR